MSDEVLIATLDEAARGTLAPNMALMRLLMAASPPQIIAALGARTASADLDAVSRTRLDRLMALLAENPKAWETVQAVLAEAQHDRASEHDAVAHWASVFDRLAQRAPEAAVALYALGSPDLLAAATGEVVGRMRDWTLLGPDRHLLEIGCGIGRLAVAGAVVRTIVLCIVACRIVPGGLSRRILASGAVGFLGRGERLFGVRGVPYREHERT